MNMINFMQSTPNFDENNFKFFDRKNWLAEWLLDWIRSRLYWNSEGKVSLITENNQDITDRFYWVMYEDSERLKNTELEGIVMIMKDKKAVSCSMAKEIVSYDKESISHLLDQWWLKVVFVATDLLTFLMADFTHKWYWDRKFAIEDVLISIDNTFEMRFKDYYTLSHPMPNTKDIFLTVCLQWYRGMIFKKVNSPYETGISKNWQELVLVSNKE